MPEVNITPETSTDNAAHIEAMVAKAEGRTPEQEAAGEPAKAAEQAPAERPAWLPAKFATPEDMAKAYAALEGKLGGKKEGDDTVAAGEGEDAAETKEGVDEAAKQAVQAAGLDMNALGNKIAQNGDLDAADYAKLEQQGISKEMVQSYVAGQQAIAQQLVARMHETVGGEETFNNILTWAGENLSKEEIAAFNTTIDSGSEASIRLALQGLDARFRAAGGAAPKLVGAPRTAAASGDVFRSTAEITKAMADPRYARDPAYRADVMRKLERSSVI